MSKEDQKAWLAADRAISGLYAQDAEMQKKFFDDALEMKSGRSAFDEDFGFEDEKFSIIRDEYVVPDEKTLKTNASLRKTGRVSTKVERFDSLVAQGEIKAPTRVYRAAILQPDQVETLKVGTSFTDRGFQSTGTEMSDAVSYGNMRSDNITGAKVLFDYELQPKLNAVNVGYGELVIQRNAKVTIVGLGQEGDYKVVYAEVSK